MKGKGKQFMPHARKVMMAFPGGAGYGNPVDRNAASIRRDLAYGYITADFAREQYGMAEAEIDEVLKKAGLGEIF